MQSVAQRSSGTASVTRAEPRDGIVIPDIKMLPIKVAGAGEEESCQRTTFFFSQQQQRGRPRERLT